MKRKKNKELLNALKIIEQDHPEYSFEKANDFLRLVGIMEELGVWVEPIPKKYKKRRRKKL